MNSGKPWDKLPKETQRAYSAFLRYLELGNARQQIEIVKICKAAPCTVNGWFQKYRWKDRAEAYDRYIFEKSVENRVESREKARQRAIDNIDEIIMCLMDILRGKCVGGDLDTRGEPIVKPSTRLQAGIHLLGISGVTIPKRMEISGPDGSEIQLSARRAISQLSDEKLQALDAAFVEVKQLTEGEGDE